ncbi:MAG: glycosyltransferase family 2 protein [Prolixibacteraceae bacterium]|nr:glycosyltransferase family 2 protein [Prolixibacteraceae bacterium]
MKTVSAIICAFNEEKTIKDVICSISGCRIFNEIIVVNDGSTDDTKRIITDCKDTIDFMDVHLPENKGKGYAMAIGIEKSTSEILVFIDADLTELSAIQLATPFKELIIPIQNNEADMVLGQPFVTILNFKVNPFKSLTGERSVKRTDILPLLNKMKTSRFGVETLINLYYQATGKIVKYVLLPELDHLSKFSKASPLSAAKEYINEGHEIAYSTLKNYDLIIKSIKNSIDKTMKSNNNSTIT